MRPVKKRLESCWWWNCNLFGFIIHRCRRRHMPKMEKLTAEGRGGPERLKIGLAATNWVEMAPSIKRSVVCNKAILKGEDGCIVYPTKDTLSIFAWFNPVISNLILRWKSTEMLISQIHLLKYKRTRYLCSSTRLFDRMKYLANCTVYQFAHDT